MIFAAGLGTRLRPLTDTMPKALVPVAGKPLLWHVVMKLRNDGFERIVINVHHFAQQIVDYVEQNQHFGLDIRFSDETGQLLETGGGIKNALPLFSTDSPILIHNVDILSNADLTALYNTASHSQADALLLVSQRTTQRYLLFDNDMRMKGWINTATGQMRPDDCSEGMSTSSYIQRAFSGIHVLRPTLFPLLMSMPQRFPIMDFYIDHCRSHSLIGIDSPGLQLLDVGKADTLKLAADFLTLMVPKA